MNLYDAYMTSRDRAECPLEVQEVLAPVRPMPTAPPAAPVPPQSGPMCDRFPSLAMVYAPCQCFHKLYERDEALSRGTLFRELDKPLEVGGRR